MRFTLVARNKSFPTRCYILVVISAARCHRLRRKAEALAERFETKDNFDRVEPLSLYRAQNIIKSFLLVFEQFGQPIAAFS